MDPNLVPISFYSSVGLVPISNKILKVLTVIDSSDQSN